MVEERRDDEVQNLERQLKQREEEHAAALTAAQGTPEIEIARNTCDVSIQAMTQRSEIIEEPEPVEETKDEEEKWLDLTEIEPMYEEIEFTCEPVEGDKLELYNERRVYKAEMSQNSKAVA